MSVVSLSLYKMASDYESLMCNLYDYETGEINMEVDAQLNALSDTVENKCIAISKWINKLESEKKQIEFMEEQIIQRKAAYNKEIQARTIYLENNMKRLGIDKIQCPFFTLKIKTNPYSTEITDATLLPSKFIRKTEKIVVSESPDKNAIKEEFIKTGVPIPGAVVQRNTKLEILINKI